MSMKFWVPALFAVLMLSCSSERAQSAGAGDDAIAFKKQTVSAFSSPTPETPVKVVGCFSNIDGNGEHEWGYALDIWEQGGSIYGLLYGGTSTRLVGDPPTGVLVEQSYDNKTRRFSFKSTLPYNTYAFDGEMTATHVRGKLVELSTNTTENIVLKRSKRLSEEMMIQYDTLEEWKAYVEKILKRRGPKS